MVICIGGVELPVVQRRVRREGDGHGDAVEAGSVAYSGVFLICRAIAPTFVVALAHLRVVRD